MFRVRCVRSYGVFLYAHHFTVFVHTAQPILLRSIAFRSVFSFSFALLSCLSFFVSLCVRVAHIISIRKCMPNVCICKCYRSHPVIQTHTTAIEIQTQAQTPSPAIPLLRSDLCSGGGWRQPLHFNMVEGTYTFTHSNTKEKFDHLYTSKCTDSNCV